MKNKKLVSIILSIILGLIYLISGIAKAADINGFADIIVRYGNTKLYILAPVITFLEIVLAFAFLLFWNIRTVALFSFSFINSLSLIFLLGYLFLDIDDCGCLGDFYTFPLWLSLLRNVFMILASYWLYKNAITFKINRFEIIKPITAISLGLITFFISFLEMKETYSEISYTQGDKIINTFLENYEEKGAKKRLIFIFSPHCGHCMQITPKVNELLNQKVYDEVIGLYPQEVPENFLKKYLSNFNPSFKIVPVPSDSIRKLLHRYPIFVTLKNGKIQKIMKEI